MNHPTRMPEACLADGFRFATCVWEIDDFKSPSTLDCSTISFRMCYLVFCRVLSGYYISLCSSLLYFHNLLYSSQQKKGKSRNPCVRPHLKSCNVRNTYYHYEQSSCGQIRIYECKICSAGVCLSSRAPHQACDLRLLLPPQLNPAVVNMGLLLSSACKKSGNGCGTWRALAHAAGLMRTYSYT